MGDAERFRTHFWQKLAPLVALPPFVLVLALSRVSANWSTTTWSVCAVILGAFVARYLWKTWQQSSVLLDDEGMTLYLRGSLETWPFRKLLHVKQIGKFRVRMCYDPDIPDQHMHIKVDLLDSDRFVDALLDRYALATGHELPEPEADAA